MQVEKEESIRDILRVRPMSKLTGKFSEEKAGRVEGVLLHFNDELFPKLAKVKDELAKELSLFVDWSGNSKVDLLALPQHGRSLSFNRLIVDKNGEVYRYLDLKGVGMKKSDSIHEPIQNAISEVWGLMDYEDAKKDWEMSGVLIKNGVKTAAPFAIIQLNQIITANGERVSVEELKKQGRIPEEYQPVVYVRAFSEFMRVHDAEKQDFEKFAKEHRMSVEEYVKWWIKEEARNLSRIHSAGMTHNGVHIGNVTLDGRIVDNNSVYPERKGYKDIGMVVEVISYICEKTGMDAVENCKFFINEYFKNRDTIEKEEFREIYKKMRIEGLPIREEIAALFERKFGEIFY